jgi:rhomboid family protein
MFPIRDHNPSSRTPWVTRGLIALNVLTFLAMLPSMGSDRSLYALYNAYALVPAEFSAGIDRWTVITSMFMHAGFWHIAGNMLFLYIFGDNMEDQFGPVLFLGFYLACGTAGDLLEISADPQSRVPTLGASGAIAGVMGGYLLLFPRARVDVLVFIVFFVRLIALPAWAMLGLWFGIQLFYELGAPAGQGGVAYAAHIGGFLAGLALTLPIWLARGGGGFWARTDGRPPHAAGDWSATRLPQVRRRR